MEEEYVLIVNQVIIYIQFMIKIIKWMQLCQSIIICVIIVIVH